MVHYEVLEHDEEALLYRYNGQVKLLKGPRRLWLVRSKLRRLSRYTAQADEYLKVEYVDGSVEHKNGPCTLFHNVFLQKSITVQKCFCLDANQAIVVYKNQKNDQCVKETIHGPNMYTLKPGEWVHEFAWHGCDDLHKTRFVAGKNTFKILNCAPNQFYYNVDEVRTADDALIKIKLMLFYELKNIDKMMLETKDPIGDFINCCCSDVVTFTASKTYMDFIENSFRLNELTQYPRLTERAGKIGYEITKVVFRGYFASPKLQAMHDNSIKTRTQLKLDFESEVQFQEAEDNNLECEIKRLQMEQDLEFQRLTHKNNLEKNSIENSSKIELEKNIKKVELETKTKLIEIEKKRESYKVKLEHLKNLKNLNVNLTDFLILSITKATKLIQIINKNQNDTQNTNNFANIHFHQ